MVPFIVWKDSCFMYLESDSCFVAGLKGESVGEVGMIRELSTKEKEQVLFKINLGCAVTGTLRVS